MPPVPYCDFVAWRRTRESQANLDYWKTKLSDSELTIDFRELGNRAHVDKTIELLRYEFSDRLTAKLSQVSKQNGNTTFVSILALLTILLHKYMGQRQIVMGTDTSGRNHRLLENQVGLLLNTLVLKSDVTQNDSFSSLVKRIQNTIKEDLLHQEYSYTGLANEFFANGETGSLFNVLVLYQDFDQTFVFPGSAVLVRKREMEVAQRFADLQMEFAPGDSGLKLTIQFNPTLFTRAIIDRMVLHMEKLVDTFVEKPTALISDYHVLQSSERQDLLTLGRGTVHVDRTEPRARSVVKLFLRQAKSTPQAIAVICDNEFLSYAELDEKSDRIAAYLRSVQGVSATDMVAVSLSPVRAHDTGHAGSDESRGNLCTPGS